MSIRLELPLFLLIIFSVFAVFSTIPHEDQYYKYADEGYYFMYAKAIKDKGLGQFPVLFEHHMNDKVAQLFPHPARIGHVMLTALWFKIFPNTFVWLARFSFFCFVLFLLVSFYFSGKFFGRQIAYLYTVLLSSSPLIMASGRRALQDACVNLFWCLAVWFFLDFLTSRKRSKFIFFLAAYSFSITLKESSMILFVFFALGFLLYKYKYKVEISNWYLAGVTFIPVLAVGLAYVLLIKGPANVFTLFKFILSVHFPSAITNSYSLFGRGPWYKYIIDYILVTPITSVLCIGYLFYFFVSRKFEEKITYFMLFFLVIFSIFGNLKYTKIIRFVSILEISVSLFAVFMLQQLFRQKNENFERYCVFAAVLIIFLVNYSGFLYLFVERDIYDPISVWLLKAREIIP